MCVRRTFPISHSFGGHFNKHGSRGSVSGETSAAAPQNFRQYPMQIVPQARKGKLISLPSLPSCSYSLWTRQIGLFTLSAARRKFGNPPPPPPPLSLTTPPVLFTRPRPRKSGKFSQSIFRAQAGGETRFPLNNRFQEMEQKKESVQFLSLLLPPRIRNIGKPQRSKNIWTAY